MYPAGAAIELSCNCLIYWLSSLPVDVTSAPSSGLSPAFPSTSQLLPPPPSLPSRRVHTRSVANMLKFCHALSHPGLSLPLPTP